MATQRQLEHAVVIGGSMAGLLAARVLSDHFRQVTILERDPVHDQPESRKGQPQTRHLHGLLAAGLQTMAAYFPDLQAALAAGGTFTGDMGEGMNWYTHGGYRRRLTLGLVGATMTRPFLEHLVRQRVHALPNVTLRDRCDVRDLLASPDRARITGLVLEPRDGSGDAETLRADLVVDCSGRGSRTPRWLEALGYGAVPETMVQVNVGYASRLYRRDPADPRGQQWTMCTPDAPAETRFGALFPVEGERWIVSMGGWNGDYPPTDEAGYLAYARSLPMPDIYQLISRAEPLTEIVAHKYRASLRRHYERLERFPAGLLVLGDALCSFNPTYGQGMTSAALQAQALDRLLQERKTLAELAPAFFHRAAKVVDIPWQLSVGEDFRFADTVGERPRGIAFINRYVSRVHRATHRDAVVGQAFLRVMNLLAPPQSLFHPRILWRVLRYGGRQAPSRSTAQARGRLGQEALGR